MNIAKKYLLSIPGQPDRVISNPNINLIILGDNIKKLGGTLTPIIDPIISSVDR